MFSDTAYYFTLWIHLIIVLPTRVVVVLARPLSLEKNVNWNEISVRLEINKTFSAEDETAYDKQIPDYDLTLDGSGFPFYYEVDSSSVESCPLHCTCVVETVVYCSRQGITAISSDSLSYDSNEKVLSGYLPTLTESVHLGYNNLTSLPPRLLTSIIPRESNHISHLYLQNNNIYKINPDAFIDLPNLQTLDLSYNDIGGLNQPCEQQTDSDLMNGINNAASCIHNTTGAIFLQSMPDTLTSLNLNNNSIRGIPNYSFSSLKRLEVLRLSWNQITWISKKAFYGLHKLKVLQLRANPLRQNTVAKLGDILHHFVTGEIYIPHKKPKDVLLDSSYLYPNVNKSDTHTTRQRRNIDIGTELRTIQLNSLENLDLGETNLDSFPPELPSSIERLYLDNNYISKIPSKTLSTLHRLELLQLGGNSIDRIEDHTFSSKSSLQILDLSRNDIKSVMPNSFHGMQQLWSLRLYGNRRLSALPYKVFWSLPSLRLVYLHDCNLSALPSGPWLFRIYALWLYGNPLDCNCGNILSLLVRLHSPFSDKHRLRMDPYRSVIWDDSDTWNYQRPEKTRCNLPDNFRGYKVEDVRISDMRCTYQDAYDVEISRRVASSKFVSVDYQEDESMTTDDTEHQIVTREEGGMVFENKKSPAFDEFENESEKLYIEDKIVPTVKNSPFMDDLPNLLDFVLPTNNTYDKTMNESREQLDDGKATVKSISNHELSEQTLSDQNFKPPVMDNNMISEKNITEDSSSHNFGREWQISFPAGASLQNFEGVVSNKELNNETEQDHFDNLFYKSDQRTYRDLVLPSKISSGEMPTENHVSSIGVSPSEDKRSNQDMDANPTIYINPTKYYDWEEMEADKVDVEVDVGEHLQGYAEHITYDSGLNQFDKSQPINHIEEIEKTLNESDIFRLRKNLKGLDGWKSYQEYYSDVEFSGQEYVDSLSAYKIAEEVKRLSELGATLDDVIGNLSSYFNVSDSYQYYYNDDDYQLTTDATSLSIDDDSVVDYDNS